MIQWISVKFTYQCKNVSATSGNNSGSQFQRKQLLTDAGFRPTTVLYTTMHVYAIQYKVHINILCARTGESLACIPAIASSGFPQVSTLINGQWPTNTGIILVATVPRSRIHPKCSIVSIFIANPKHQWSIDCLWMFFFASRYSEQNQLKSLTGDKWRITHGKTSYHLQISTLKPCNLPKSYDFSRIPL